MGKANKVVLAYSGGLDTSVIIPWLKENYGAEVIAVCVDLGQPEDYDAVEKKAIKSGASKAYIVDAKEEFVKDYVWPTVKAGAIYEGKYLLGTSFARPLIGKILVDIAKKEISKVFSIKKEAIENDIDTGFYKDKIGICPICGKDVLKSKYGYGCIGYKDGCNFKINFTICNRIISKKNAELLLKTGKTSKIVGFTSKNGKSFDAYLKNNNGKIEFEFN